MNKTLIRIGAYSRVSTQEQEKNDDQVSKITDYVEQNYRSGEYSIEYYNDLGYSGNTVDRPSYSRLLEDVSKKELDIIVVTTFSELAQDVGVFGDLAKLCKKGDVEIVLLEKKHLV